jgi:hypothetical protein
LLAGGSSSSFTSYGFGSLAGSRVESTSGRAGTALAALARRALALGLGLGLAAVTDASLVGVGAGTASLAPSALGGGATPGATGAGVTTGATKGWLCAAAEREAVLRASARVKSEAAAADASDDSTINRLEERWTCRKSLAATTLKSMLRGPCARRWVLSVVVGASVCGGVGGALRVVRSGCTGERSKLIVAAGRSYTANTSGSSLRLVGGDARRGDDGRGLDGRDCG